MKTEILENKENVSDKYTLQYFSNPYPDFGFSLVIPKDWLWFEKEGRPEEPNGKLQKLAAYGDRTDQSLIEVYALALEREIAPEDWLEQWVIANHYQVLDHRSIPSIAGRNADVILGKMVADRPLIYRLRTFKNGKFLYLLSCFSDADHYPDVEDAFILAAQTFTLTNSPEQPYAEPMQEIPLSKVFQSSFKVPATWTAQPDESVGEDSQSWNLGHGKGTNRLGILNAYSVPHHILSSAQAAGDQVTAAMRQLGFEIDANPLQQIDNDMPDISLYAGAVDILINDKPAVFRQTVVGTVKGWAVFSLLSPAPWPDDYLIGPINHRAFDIAWGSFLASLLPQRRN